MSESFWSKFVNGTKKVFKEGKKAVKVAGASFGALVGGVAGTSMIVGAIAGLATGGVALIPSLISGLVGAGCLGLGVKSARIAKEALSGQNSNHSISSNLEQEPQGQPDQQSSIQVQKPSIQVEKPPFLERLEKGVKGVYNAVTSPVGIVTGVACLAFPALLPFAMIAAAYSGYKSMQTKGQSEGHIPNQNSPQPQNPHTSFKGSPYVSKMQQKFASQTLPHLQGQGLPRKGKGSNNSSQVHS